MVRKKKKSINIIILQRFYTGQTNNILKSNSATADIIIQSGSTEFVRFDASETRTQFQQDVMLVGGGNYIQVDNSEIGPKVKIKRYGFGSEKNLEDKGIIDEFIINTNSIAPLTPPMVT